MRNNLFIIILLLICPLSYADLGHIYVDSYLQQNLVAKISINNTYDEIPVIAIASREQFKKLGIEYNNDIGLLSSKLLKLDNNNYELYITSIKPINTPIFNILLHYQINNNDKYKQYNILLDPINLKTD